MIKSVPVLALEGGMLHSVWVENTPSGPVRHDVRSWLTDESSLNDDVGGGGDVPPSLSNVEDGGDEQLLVSALKGAVKFFNTKEFAVCVPLSSTLTKVVEVPLEVSDEISDLAQNELEAVSPFPDDVLNVGVESLGETDVKVSCLASAYPEQVAFEYASAFEEAGISIVHTDINVLGRINMMWKDINADNGVTCRLALFDFGDGWDMCIFKNGVQTYLRSLGKIVETSTLHREILLTLISQGRLSDIGEVVLCTASKADPSVVEAVARVAPVREIVREDVYLAAEGCARRMMEEGSLDITPLTWSTRLAETRFVKKAKKVLVSVFSVVALIFAVFIAVPMVLDAMTDSEKDKCKRHKNAYRAVSDMRDRVHLVRRYSNYSRGLLEMLKVVTEIMPEGVTLNSFGFQGRETDEANVGDTYEMSAEEKNNAFGNIKLSGEADAENLVYDFKDSIVKCGRFIDIELKGPTQVKDRNDKSKLIHRFDINMILAPIDGDQAEGGGN